jgi:regulatory protein YycI of two-component signal transduction system YycFG
VNKVSKKIKNIVRIKQFEFSSYKYFEMCKENKKLFLNNTYLNVVEYDYEEMNFVFYISVKVQIQDSSLKIMGIDISFVNYIL